MALTKPRAYQIYDIDYKQAVRVVTTTNTTLAGGAPNSVDGVNLVLNDRVLVTGQSTGSQNGLYYVTTVGSGSNGTWSRSVDGDVTGELLAGLIVMVTEGNTYADTQWKLITNDPIVLGTTALDFVINSTTVYFANIIAGGNTLSAAGNTTLTFAAGSGMSITGNNVSNTITFISTASGGGGTSISNGTSNVNVVSSGGNVTVGVSGVGNVAVFAPTGEYVTGLLSVTGNIIGGTDLYVGSGAALTAFTNPIAIFKDSGSGYVQVAVVNATGNASADMITYGNNGDDNTGWADIGYTGNTFNDTNYTITAPNDGYLFAQGNSVTGGNLVLATGNTGSTRDIVFSFGFLSTNEFLRFQQTSNTMLPYANTAVNIGSSSKWYNSSYVASQFGTVISATGNITSGNVSTGNIQVNKQLQMANNNGGTTTVFYMQYNTANSSVDFIFV